MNDTTDSTRSRLIVSGRASFARRGFDGSSVRAITGDAGTNLGAITYHFGSKRKLYDAVLEDGLRPLVERVRGAASEGGTALDRIVRIVEAYFEHLAIHPDLPHLLLQEVAAGKGPPPVVAEIVGEIKVTLARLTLEGVDDGSVRAGDPTLTALSIVAQPIYLTLVAPVLRVVAHVDLTDHSTRETVVAHATDFVRRGLTPSAEIST